MKPSQHAFERVLAVILACVVSAVTGYAQATSRVIPFPGVQTTLPASTTQAITVQMFDEAGTLITAEDHPTVVVDEAGRISFLFGSMTGGLNPDHFPSGSSRSLDVIDPATGASVLTSGRIALHATAFALSPGPQGPQGEIGPQGPQGERGPQGPPGTVTIPFSGSVASTSPVLHALNTGSGHGVWGISLASNGVGVRGSATNGATATGVWGDSQTGFGVDGQGSTGVRGTSTVAGGRGVFGQSSTGAGVYAKPTVAAPSEACKASLPA